VTYDHDKFNENEHDKIEIANMPITDLVWIIELILDKMGKQVVREKYGMRYLKLVDK
jgi:hypothetical protein